MMKPFAWLVATVNSLFHSYAFCPISRTGDRMMYRSMWLEVSWRANGMQYVYYITKSFCKLGSKTILWDSIVVEKNMSELTNVKLIWDFDEQWIFHKSWFNFSCSLFILIGKEFLQTHICGINIRSEPSVPQVAKKKSLHNQSLFGKDGGVVLTSFCRTT